MAFGSGQIDVSPCFTYAVNSRYLLGVIVGEYEGKKEGKKFSAWCFVFSFVIFVYSLQDTAHRRLGIYIGSRLKI